MPKRKFKFRCGYCRRDTEISFEVPDIQKTSPQPTISRIHYCSYRDCNRENIINIPQTWDVVPLVLGDDEILEYSDGVPIIQGYKKE